MELASQTLLSGYHPTRLSEHLLSIYRRANCDHAQEIADLLPKLPVLDRD